MARYKENHNQYIQKLFAQKKADPNNVQDAYVLQLKALLPEQIFSRIEEDDFVVNYKRSAADYILRQEVEGRNIDTTSSAAGARRASPAARSSTTVRTSAVKRDSGTTATKPQPRLATQPTKAPTTASAAAPTFGSALPTNMSDSSAIPNSVAKVPTKLPYWLYYWEDECGNKRVGIALLLLLGTELQDITIDHATGRKGISLDFLLSSDLFDSEKLLSHKIFGKLFPPKGNKQSAMQTAMNEYQKRNSADGDDDDDIICTMQMGPFKFATTFTPETISGHPSIVAAKYNKDDPQKAALVLHIDLIQDNPKFPRKQTSAAAAEGGENAFDED